jgi:hypothetical protein
MEVSGINFKNYATNDGELAFGAPLALDNFTIDDIPYFGGVVNGVEIDWNSAELPNVNFSELEKGSTNECNTVVNTGQLMALINDMQGQINAIAAKLAELQ